MNPFAYLGRWVAARRGTSWFAGITRSVAPRSALTTRWDTAPVPRTAEEWRDLVAIASRIQPYREAPLPPGWTRTECGALPPGWTVRDGRPVRPP